MKAALIGYGKMGQAIAHILEERGHHIVLRASDEQYDDELLRQADVALEFTQPDAAVGNLKQCFAVGVPVVTGTTGWQDQYEEVAALCRKAGGGLLYASNFSLGVNLFFALNKHLAQLMEPYPEYRAQLEEIHHTEKKDQPSGTAITLAQDILTQQKRYRHWQLGSNITAEHTLGVTAQRISDVPGTHSVQYHSKQDTLEIKHTAHSRQGFAKGAALAAEFMAGKQGLYTMQDVLKLPNL